MLRLSGPNSGGTGVVLSLQILDGQIGFLSLQILDGRLRPFGRFSLSLDLAMVSQLRVDEFYSFIPPWIDQLIGSDLPALTDGDEICSLLLVLPQKPSPAFPELAMAEARLGRS
jgi:hypothetical protein